MVKTEAFHADFFTAEKLKEMFSFRVSCTETQDARWCINRMGRGGGGTCTFSFNNSNFTYQTPSRLIKKYREGFFFQERKNLVDMNGSMVIQKRKWTARTRKLRGFKKYVCIDFNLNQFCKPSLRGRRLSTFKWLDGKKMNRTHYPKVWWSDKYYHFLYWTTYPCPSSLIVNTQHSMPQTSFVAIKIHCPRAPRLWITICR